MHASGCKGWYAERGGLSEAGKKKVDLILMMSWVKPSILCQARCIWLYVCFDESLKHCFRTNMHLAYLKPTQLTHEHINEVPMIRQKVDMGKEDRGYEGL